MQVQTFKTKGKFKETKRFAGGHGAARFLPSTNPAWYFMISLRLEKASGQLVETDREPITAEGAQRAMKTLSLYA